MRTSSKLLLAFVVCNSIRLNFSQRSSKIIGGDFAAKNQFPHLVAVLFKNRFKCGGNIVAKKWILTAPRCVDDIPIRGLSVLAGTNLLNETGVQKDVIKKIVHFESFLGTRLRNVALLKLKTGLPLSDSVKVIQFFTKTIPDGAYVITAGWGKTANTKNAPYSNRLKYHIMRKISWNDCYDVAEHSIASICAYCIFCLSHTKNNGICYGDFGGSAVYANKLAGISSVVIGGCGTYMPDVFLQMSDFADWVREEIKLNQD